MAFKICSFNCWGATVAAIASVPYANEFKVVSMSFAIHTLQNIIAIMSDNICFIIPVSLSLNNKYITALP